MIQITNLTDNPGLHQDCILSWSSVLAVGPPVCVPALHHPPVPSPTSTVASHVDAKAPTDPSPLCPGNELKHRHASAATRQPLSRYPMPWTIHGPLHPQLCRDRSLISPFSQWLVSTVETFTPKPGHPLEGMWCYTTTSITSLLVSPCSISDILHGHHSMIS